MKKLRNFFCITIFAACASFCISVNVKAMQRTSQKRHASDTDLTTPEPGKRQKTNDSDIENNNSTPTTTALTLTTAPTPTQPVITSTTTNNNIPTPQATSSATPTTTSNPTTKPSSSATSNNPSNGPAIPANLLISLMNQYVEETKKILTRELKEGEYYIQKKVLDEQNIYCVVGDIHGQYPALERILKDLIKNGYLDNNLKIINPSFYIIFTGDYTDRLLQGVNVWGVILRLKLNPGNFNHVFLLRGNHENHGVNTDAGGSGKAFSFHAELEKTYPQEHTTIIKAIDELYNYLPQALFINNRTKDNNSMFINNWMMFCHGGLFQPDIISEFLNSSDSSTVKVIPFPIERFSQLIEKTKYPKKYVYSFSGFLWQDVINENFQSIHRFTNNQTPQEIKDIFSKAIPNIPISLLKELDIKILCRGHQHHGHGLKIGTSAEKSAIPDPNNIQPIPISSIQPPIFTFTTATAYILSTDVFYGIIQTTNNFDQWELIPHLLYRLPPPPSPTTSTSSNSISGSTPTKANPTTAPSNTTVSSSSSSNNNSH